MSEEIMRLDSELAILGSAFIRPNVIGEVMGKVSADDFLHPAHRAIWAAMVELWLKEEPLEPAIIAARASSIGTPEMIATIGGADFITLLPNQCIVFETLPYHVRKIRQSGQRYRWGQSFAKLAARAVNPSESDADYLDAVGGELVKMMLTQNAAEGTREKSRKQVLKSAVADIEEAYKNRSARFLGVPTGIEALDTASRGLRAGQLVVLAARPGVGKSAMMGQMAEAAAAHGLPVLVFSLEMSAEELGKRLLSSESGVDAQRISSGDLETKHFASITSAASRLSTRNVTTIDISGCSVAEIRSISKRWRIAHPEGLGLIAIDYLQIVKPTQRDVPREQQVSEISQALKGMAKDLQVPVLALAQLNRKLEDRTNKRPGMGDLRESGQIEQDADVILFIHREDIFTGNVEDQGKAELICAKGRSMPTFKANLGWQPQFTRFVNLSQRHD